MDWKEFFSEGNLQFIGTLCGAIIFTGYISFKTFKTKLDKWLNSERTNVAKNVAKQSVIDCEIIKEAEKVKEFLNADRVQVYEFHNGIHYANGRSALRTSCTYETCRYGVSSCINSLSGIPLSVIPNFMKTLLDKGELYIKDLEDIKEVMPSAYSLKKSMNIKSFYDFVIHNSKGESVGFVAVQFCNEGSKVIDKDIVKKFAWFVETKLSDAKNIE